MATQALTKAEQAVIDQEVRPWAKTIEVTRTAPGRKLLRVVAFNEGDFYFTLLGDQEPLAVLLPFLRGLHRFSTASRPTALDACYVASWYLPRPDFHR